MYEVTKRISSRLGEVQRHANVEEALQERVLSRDAAQVVREDVLDVNGEVAEVVVVHQVLFPDFESYHRVFGHVVESRNVIEARELRALRRVCLVDVLVVEIDFYKRIWILLKVFAVREVPVQYLDVSDARRCFGHSGGSQRADSVLASLRRMKQRNRITVERQIECQLTPLMPHS